jgi:hypothetical protein
MWLRRELHPWAQSAVRLGPLGRDFARGVVDAGPEALVGFTLEGQSAPNGDVDMRSRSWYSTLAPVYSCLLVLAASGDDFNLLRVVAPSAFVQTSPGTLPEDDANSDFTRPDRSEAQGQTDFHPDGWSASPSESWTARCVAGRDTPSGRAAAAPAWDGRPASMNPRPPLRC